MYCFKCGKQISDDSQFCRYCGASISENTVPQTVSQTVNNKQYQTKLIAFLAFLAVIFVLFIVVKNSNSSSSRANNNSSSLSSSVPSYPDPTEQGFTNQPSKITADRPILATRNDMTLNGAKIYTGYYRKALEKAGFTVKFYSDNSDDETYDYGYILYYNDKVVGIYGETTIIDEDGDYFTLITISTKV